MGPIAANVLRIADLNDDGRCFGELLAWGSFMAVEIMREKSAADLAQFGPKNRPSKLMAW
jgi:hypothetical protein